jgi:hypothetical protein
MEPFYSNNIIKQLENFGFTYFHGVNERTSVFFNKDTGRFISYKNIQSTLESDCFMTEFEIKISIENLIISLDNEHGK